MNSFSQSITAEDLRIGTENHKPPEKNLYNDTEIVVVVCVAHDVSSLLFIRIFSGNFFAGEWGATGKRFGLIGGLLRWELLFKSGHLLSLIAGTGQAVSVGNVHFDAHILTVLENHIHLGFFFGTIFTLAHFFSGRTAQIFAVELYVLIGIPNLLLLFVAVWRGGDFLGCVINSLLNRWQDHTAETETRTTNYSSDDKYERGAKEKL